VEVVHRGMALRVREVLAKLIEVVDKSWADGLPSERLAKRGLRHLSKCLLSPGSAAFRRDEVREAQLVLDALERGGVDFLDGQDELHSDVEDAKPKFPGTSRSPSSSFGA
jgi:hypothetical protein